MKDQFHPNQLALFRVGLLLVLVGLGYVISTYLKNAWLPYIVYLLFLVIQSVIAIAKKNSLDFIFCIFGLSTCLGSFSILSSNFTDSVFSKTGVAVLALGFAFLLIDIFYFYKSKKAGRWAFFIGLTTCFSSIPLLIDEINILSFVLWTGLGAGGGMVLWGLVKRLPGLIIAGCLLSSMSFGVYAAWNQVVSPNGLTETGIMLVWFGLGWGSISILSRLRLARYLGWPLIPAGILGVAGWGLYSGGDPNSALNFIGNTGSLGVLIFGLYFLLMKRGIGR